LIAALIDRILEGYCRLVPDHQGKWRLVAAAQNLARPAWTSARTVTHDGICFELDLNDLVSRYVYYGVYETPETHLVKQLVKWGWVCVDAGAHVGYYSLLFSQLVGPGGRVLAFEPCSDVRRSLMRNLSLNSGNRVDVHDFALSDYCGWAHLERNATNSGGSQLASCGERVRVRTLDSFLEENSTSRVDFIKADVEGCETRLLRGGMRTLRRFKPPMLLEINPLKTASFGNTVEEMLGLLAELGYTIEQVRRRGLVSNWRLPEPGDSCNVIAIPEERRAAIAA